MEHFDEPRIRERRKLVGVGPYRHRRHAGIKWRHHSELEPDERESSEGNDRESGEG